MNKSSVEVTVTTTEDRDDVFAELFVDGVQWGEVSLAPNTNTPTLIIFPPLDGNPYKFSVDDLKNALDEAVARLRRVEGV